MRIKLPPKPQKSMNKNVRDFKLVFKVNDAHLKGEDKPLEKCLIY